MRVAGLIRGAYRRTRTVMDYYLQIGRFNLPVSFVDGIHSVERTRNYYRSAGGLIEPRTITMAIRRAAAVAVVVSDALVIGR